MAQDVTSQLQEYYDGEIRDRATWPLGHERSHCIGRFLATAQERGVRSVVEVGCGAGRDGQLITGAGLDYSGVDLSAVAVEVCREVDLRAVRASATDLPFPSDAFDAAWSMSTLMHLPGQGFRQALAELRRVVRPGGPVEVGVWGHTSSREWRSPDNRYFRHRPDDELQAELGRIGRVVAFETWDRLVDGGHYQWARVEVAGDEGA